jgi:two-component system chemotaxis response regulator CheB
MMSAPMPAVHRPSFTIHRSLSIDLITMNQPIRVVVVDDSALMRDVIAGLLQQDPAIQVVGVAGDGCEAIRLVQELRPDVVTMDVRMPVMDGLAATEHLMAYCPTPILVLTSLGRSELDITFRMLGAGALEVMEKPSAATMERSAHHLIRRVKTLSRVRVVTHLRGRRRAAPLPERRPARPAAHLADRGARNGAGGVPHNATPRRTATPAPSHDFPLIVIGASTGGPRVVYRLLAGLPPDLPAAVLVVQHIAAGFAPGMAEWLAHACPLPVAVAAEGQALRPGEVLIAPDHRDTLITEDGRIHLSANPLLIQRPAIDVAMQAAAYAFGPRAIGVLLTGMGRDGAYGMLRIRRAGGYTIAQDEASSTIFGMPRAAIELGAATEVLAPAQIPARLVELVMNARAPERGAP